MISGSGMGSEQATQSGRDSIGSQPVTTSETCMSCLAIPTRFSPFYPNCNVVARSGAAFRYPTADKQVLANEQAVVVEKGE